MFIVLYTTDELTEVQAKVCHTREGAREFSRLLQNKENVQAYSTCRVGETLGSFTRHGQRKIK